MWLKPWVPWAAALFPLLLLLNRGTGFNIDWDIHLWIAGYFGQYLKKNFEFPSVINVGEGVGIALPVFYGTVFYPIVGLISAFLGSGLAIRLLAFLVLFFQFKSIEKLFRTWQIDLVPTRVIAVLMIWAIYPLTCLYNRSALLEFFATGLLLPAVCQAFVIVRRISERQVGGEAASLCLFLLLIFGTHPITAIYGGMFLVLLLFASLSLCTNRPRLLGVALAVSGVCALGASPWIYATWTFSKDLMISQILTQINHFGYIDEWRARLMPFPYDHRALLHGVDEVESAYLDTQIGMPLLILNGALLIWSLKDPGLRFWEKWQKSRMLPLFILGALGFALTLWSSVELTPWGYLPQAFHVIQFQYRLITYVNLFLFLMAFALCTQSSQNFTKNWLTLSRAAVWIPCLSIAFLGVAIKLMHASAVRTFQTAAASFEGNPSLLMTAPYRYPYTDYIITRGFKPTEHPMDLRLNFTVAVEGPFGRTMPSRVSLKKTTGILTQVYAFPWNSLQVNGRVLSPMEIQTRDLKLFLTLPPGEHEISYVFSPDRVWLALRKLSAGIWLFCLFWKALSIFRMPRLRFVTSEPNPKDVGQVL